MIVELDGKLHASEIQYFKDTLRDKCLKEEGWKIIRITNQELKGVKTNDILREKPFEGLWKQKNKLFGKKSNKKSTEVNVGGRRKERGKGKSINNRTISRR